MEQVFNQDGQQVLPLSKYNPINPVSGAIYDDEIYNSLTNNGTQPAPPPAPAEPPVIVPPAGTEPVAPVNNSAAPADVVTPSSTTDAGTTDAPPAPVNLDEIIKEKTGGKFEKLDDILKLSENPTPQEVQFANEQSKQVFEYLREGKVDEVFNFLSQQQLLSKVDEMKPTELLQMRVQMMEGLTPEDIADEYEEQLSRYGLNVKREDFLTDDEYNKAISRAERKLKADLKPFAEELKAYRQTLELPPLQTQQANTPMTKSELDEFAEEFAKEAGNHIQSLKEIKLSATVDKDVVIDHSFTITDEQKAEFARIANDFVADTKGRYFKDGKYDIGLAQRDRFILNNLDKIVASAMTKAYMQGRLGQVMNMANATTGAPMPNVGNGFDVQVQAARDGFRDFMRRS